MKIYIKMWGPLRMCTWGLIWPSWHPCNRLCLCPKLDHISTMAYLILSTLHCFFILAFLDYTESLGLQLPKYILGAPQMILMPWLSHWRIYQPSLPHEKYACLLQYSKSLMTHDAVVSLLPAEQKFWNTGSGAVARQQCEWWGTTVLGVEQGALDTCLCSGNSRYSPRPQLH